MKLIINKMKKNKKRHSESIVGFLFIFPALFFLAALIVYPLLNTFYLSLYKTNLINIWKFNGVNNYLNQFSSVEIWDSLKITFIYTAGVVIGTLILGMIAALLLNSKIKGQSLYRSLILWPWVLSSAATVIMWRWIYSTEYGVLNDILLRLRLIGNPISWLGNTNTALLALILVGIWKAFPFAAVALLGGLQAIPIELYEAAKVDGASSMQRWRHISLPGLRNVILILVILETVWWFKEFALVNMMTEGGPLRSTETITIRAFKYGFKFFEFGNAAALGIIIFLICLIIMIIYIKAIPQEE